MLRGEPESWPEAIRDEYEERAAIKEFMGGMERGEAERQAFEELIAKYEEIPVALKEEQI